MRCVLLFQQLYLPIVLQLLLHSIIGFVPNPKRLLPHQPPFRKQHQLPSSTLVFSKSPKNKDLYQFFLETGNNEELSIYLSNFFEPRINRMNLIYFNEYYANKTEFSQFLERNFDITNELDKINIYGALSKYGKLKFEFMVHNFIMYKNPFVGILNFISSILNSP